MSRCNVSYGLGACLIFALTFLGCAPAAWASKESTLWNALRSGGHVALMRHAIAPGLGDPADFALRDCSTQRNLSDEGREQARRIGDQFRANKIVAAQVFSSQWCRCLETARLLDIGTVTELPKANSFYQDMGRQGVQTAAMIDWMASRRTEGPTVVVTHQVNITALTGQFVESGEIVVIKKDDAGRVSVVGTIEPD